MLDKILRKLLIIFFLVLNPISSIFLLGCQNWWDERDAKFTKEYEELANQWMKDNDIFGKANCHKFDYSKCDIVPIDRNPFVIVCNLEMKTCNLNSF